MDVPINLDEDDMLLPGSLPVDPAPGWGYLDFDPFSPLQDNVQWPSLQDELITGAMNALADQGSCSNQDIFGDPFSSETTQIGLFSILSQYEPGIDIGSSSTSSSFSSSSSTISSATLQQPSIDDYYFEHQPSLPISPTSFQSQTASLVSTNPPNTLGRSPMDEDSSPNLSTGLRTLLPRPPEAAPPNIDAAKKGEDLEASPRRQENSPHGSATNRRRSKKRYTCPLCLPKQVEFAWRKSLTRHQIRKHEDYAKSQHIAVGPFPCPIQGCTKVYTRRDFVTRHLNDCHGRMRRQP